MNLDRVIASACRTRIIKVLAKSGGLNIMELTRKVNSTYNQVNQHLRVLHEEGIILDRRSGRLRMIRLNKENPKTLLLLQALRILETPTGNSRSEKRQV